MSLSWLCHPLARGLDIDSPSTTHIRKRILGEKPFLRKIYEEWYRGILDVLPEGAALVLEIGSGAGFLRERLPKLITSEIFPVPDLSLVLNACQLPLADQALRAIVMTDVFHHIPDPRAFLAEAARCIRPGGAIVMIEPWNTGWSRWVYTHLHHEPFRPDAERWEFPSTGPLSGANGALPWIVFERDRSRFVREFPQWRLAPLRLMMPVRYLLSGGVSYRSLTPGWTFGLWRALEGVTRLWSRHLAMFARVVLERTDVPAGHPHQSHSSAIRFSS